MGIITKSEWVQRYPRLHQLIAELSFDPCSDEIWRSNPELSDFFNTNFPTKEQSDKILISYEQPYEERRAQDFTVYHSLILAIALDQQQHFDLLWHKMLHQIDNEMPSRMLEFHVIPEVVEFANKVKQMGGNPYFIDFLYNHNVHLIDSLPQKITTHHGDRNDHQNVAMCAYL